MADMAIPRYVAITADIPDLLASAVDFPAEGETETAALASGNNITDIIGKVLGKIAFSAGNGNIAKLDINPGGLLTALGLDEGTTNTIGAIFGDPDKEFAMDGAAISVSGLRFFRTEVAGGDDMLNTLIKVKDITVEGDKVFTSEGALGSIGVSAGLAESAKTWEIVNLSDSNVPDMYTDLDLSMLTVYEAQTQLIGNEVYFNVTTLDGQTRENVPAI